MNIGIICYPTYGGSGVVATELGMALAEKGHHVHFITYSQPARLDAFNENLFYHEVGLKDYPLFQYAPYESALASKMVDISKYHQLDILHVHYAVPHAAAAFMAQNVLNAEGIYVPFVTTLHGTDINLVGKDATYAPVVTFSINKSDGVTAVSDSLKQATYDNFEITNHIEVIPNFIDFRRFSKSNKDHFKKAIAPNGEKLLVHTSNFRRVKRVDDVLRIFQKVKKEIPAKLLLVGDGPERQHMEELARELCVGDEIRFLGKQDAVEEVLSVSDLFLMPSGSESFGLAALEAMACRVPVISSNVGGIPEINIQGETGYLSDIGNVDEMAANALSILTNDKKLEMFKRRAFEKAQEFDVNSIVPKYETFYEHVIDGVRV